MEGIWKRRTQAERIIKVENADVTGTNEYTVVTITRDTAELCAKELDGQITDGIFENSSIGNVVEIKEGGNK
jgi:hypothetical protein